MMNSEAQIAFDSPGTVHVSGGYAYHRPNCSGIPPHSRLDPAQVEFYSVRDRWVSTGCDPKWLSGVVYRWPISAVQGAPKVRQVSLPEDPEERNQMCIFDGFMAYFPNAMAEVAKLSYAATQQHHPDEPMHWDRSKSTDHLNKIGRHMIDAGLVDDKGQRHSTMVAWRAMANLQEELERDLGLPPSPASRNRPW